MKAVEGLKGRVWVVALALLAWAMAQVWATSQDRLTQLETRQPAQVREVADASLD